MPEGRKNLLIDANVLIDYQKSSLSVLSLVSRCVGEVYILTTVLEEVNELSIAECERLGLKVMKPSLIQLRLAAERRGRLSFHDHLCFILAAEQSLVCVTNDVQLRKACTKEGVNTLWGLELIKLLVQKGGIQVEDAVQVAEEIHRNNPQHISRQLVGRFAASVMEISKRRDNK